MAGEGHLDARREDPDRGNAAAGVDHIDPDRLAVAELRGDGLATRSFDRRTVQEYPKRIAAAAVGTHEHAENMELGHGLRSESGVTAPARSSASRWMATTLMASVIRPSRVIASTSSNGTQRSSMDSVGSGAASP